MKKRIGIVSYNIYCNFTNYGSALQSWALYQIIKKVAGDTVEPVLIDYCPKILENKDPLNPFANMWDQDDESRRMCELTMPAIRKNYYKFDKFYHERFNRTSKKYTAQNFNDIFVNEKIERFVCGSDTIFCIDEFGGFDDGYYANYDCMKKNSVSYAASFGDSHFNEEDYNTLNERLNNFKSIGLRENNMVQYVASHVVVPVQRVIDPTLLLTSREYDKIADERLEKEKYLLLYARRYNSKMETYAEKLAAENGWKIVEISLRATNAEKGHRMFYEAGVEEFLSLVKHAEYVVTNSFHGMIFTVQYRRPLCVFSREQCDSKITELIELFGLKDHMLVTGEEKFSHEINYDLVHARISVARDESIRFLKNEIKILL